MIKLNKLNIRKKETINNYPLPIYISENKKIVFKYEGFDLIIFIQTLLLSLALYNHCKNNNIDLDIFISCSENLKNWILEPIKYYNLHKNSKPLHVYKIISYDSIYTNHIELSKEIGIEYPLNISMLYNNLNNKSMIICCNGYKKTALPEEIEKKIYDHFIIKGFDIKILAIPFFDYSNDYWAKKILKYFLNLNEIFDIMSNSKYIICTDNIYLNIASAFKNNNVVGIFGPTIPRIITKQNSMKIIQLKDDDQIKYKNIIKSCPCRILSNCHRKNYDIPYCFKNINVGNLINKIETYLNI
jgi:hypothetical protein